jgi:hypothetical protein
MTIVALILATLAVLVTVLASAATVRAVVNDGYRRVPARSAARDTRLQ